MTNWIELLGFAISLTEMVLKNIPKTELAQEQVENAQAALDKLKEVHGTAVTKAQLDSLRG